MEPKAVVLYKLVSNTCMWRWPSHNYSAVTVQTTGSTGYHGDQGELADHLIANIILLKPRKQ